MYLLLLMIISYELFIVILHVYLTAWLQPLAGF